ncbi:MAG: zinc-ribbon domain-containing protein [Oscillospiraceae bacterium]|nr:zinc-ribbon domain-containing protein [Oscillospiraceae bacterium]
MFCHNCGARVPENSAFCQKCGTKMPISESESASKSESESGTEQINNNSENISILVNQYTGLKEYKTLEFPNTPEGQRNKILTLENLSREGWRVVSETVTEGSFKGGKACCLYLICAPLAFLAGKKDGTINVTLQRDV